MASRTQCALPIRKAACGGVEGDPPPPGLLSLSLSLSFRTGGKAVPAVPVGQD